MWRRAKVGPPWPDDEACERQAELLNEMRRNPLATAARRREFKPERRAIETLLRTAAEFLGPWEGVAPTSGRLRGTAGVSLYAASIDDLNRLVAFRLALIEALPVFDPDFVPTREMAVWFGAVAGGAHRFEGLRLRATARLRSEDGREWDLAAFGAWRLAGDALAALGGGGAGKSKGAVAVRFAALASRALGFAGRSADTVSRFLMQQGEGAKPGP